MKISQYLIKLIKYFQKNYNKFMKSIKNKKNKTFKIMSKTMIIKSYSIDYIKN